VIAIMAETLLARVRHFLVGADYSQKQQKYVTDVADHGEPSQPNVRRRHHVLYRYWKQRSENRQEISIILKYVVFGLNFIFWVYALITTFYLFILFIYYSHVNGLLHA